VTHPSHPLSGQKLVCIAKRYSPYGMRLLLRDDRDRVWSVPPQWTDVVTPDPEVVLGGARAVARVADLVELTVPLHNNASEARLRVVALGRHTFMFFGHPLAGRNFAGLYSLVGSAIANGVEPTEYLTDVLPRIREATTDEALDELLPDRWTPPAPPSDARTSAT
jgi:hypothetical protein